MNMCSVFDGIDADGFGFAPRTDLLARVSALAVDDSSLRFVVTSPKLCCRLHKLYMHCKCCVVSSNHVLPQ